MTERTRIRLGIFAAVMALWMMPSTAAAQACCSATSAGEAGVVGRCHYAMLSTSLGLDHGLGYTDREGTFQGYESSASTDAVLMLAGGIRPFDRRFRVGAVFPMRFQHRAAADLSSTAARPGDIGWSTGFLVLQDPMTGLDSPLPFLEPFLAGTIATGVDPGDSDDPLSADATSPGGSSFAGGLKVVKFVTPSNAVRLSGEYRHYFAHEMSSTRGTFDVRSGPAWEFGLGWTYEGSIFWSFGLETRLTLQGDLEEAGEAVEGSDMRRVFTGLTFRRSLSFPWWDVTAAAGQDMFLGKNLARSGVTFTLGIQRNFL